MTETSKETIERLTDTLDFAYTDNCGDGDFWPFDDMRDASATIKALAAERNAALERIKVLENALKPFADACIQIDDHNPWYIEGNKTAPDYPFKMRELRRAREALGEWNGRLYPIRQR